VRNWLRSRDAREASGLKFPGRMNPEIYPKDQFRFVRHVD